MKAQLDPLVIGMPGLDVRERAAVTKRGDRAKTARGNRVEMKGCLGGMRTLLSELKIGQRFPARLF